MSFYLEAAWTHTPARHAKIIAHRQAWPTKELMRKLRRWTRSTKATSVACAPTSSSSWGSDMATYGMGGGLAGLGMGQQQEATQLLGESAKAEAQREMENKQLRQQAKSGNASLGATGGALAGFALGAQYGAVGGPWGAVIGGLVGGIAGGAL
jgi:phage tail tape-measure protein